MKILKCLIFKAKKYSKLPLRKQNSFIQKYLKTKSKPSRFTIAFRLHSNSVLKCLHTSKNFCCDWNMNESSAVREGGRSNIMEPSETYDFPKSIKIRPRTLIRKRGWKENSAKVSFVAASDYITNPLRYVANIRVCRQFGLVFTECCSE